MLPSLQSLVLLGWSHGKIHFCPLSTQCIESSSWDHNFKLSEYLKRNNVGSIRAGACDPLQPFHLLASHCSNSPPIIFNSNSKQCENLKMHSLRTFRTAPMSFQLPLLLSASIHGCTPCLHHQPIHPLCFSHYQIL